MNDENKTKQQLIRELEELRQQVADLETAAKNGTLLFAERNQAEQALKESEERFRTIFNNAADGLVLTDSDDKKFHSCNKMFSHMLGYSEEEITKLSVVDIHPTEDLPYVIEQFKKIANKETTVNRNIPVKRKDGSIFYADIHAMPITLSGKTYLIGTFRDITERRLLEEDIRESEKKYRSLYQEFRAILDAIPDALVLLSSDLRVVWSNKVAARNMNMNVEDFIGQHCYAVRHSRSEPCEICPVLECFTSHKPNVIASTTPDGRIWELHVYPVFGDRGEVKGVIEAASDITERKRAETALHLSEEKYRLVVENANDAIFIVQNERIQFPNRKMKALTGFNEAELTGAPFFKFIHEDDRAFVVNRHRERLQGRDVPATYAFKIVDKSGDIVWVEASVVLVSWESSPAALVFLRDITVQKKLEAQLLQAQKMEAIGQLAGGIAHDFNNLLTAIIGYGHLLKNEASKEERTSSYVGQILNAAERAAILTNDLLTFSRQQIVNLQPVNLNKIIKNMKSLLARVIGEDTELSTVMTDKDLTIMADSTQIDQILMNLVTNALDAMPRGGSIHISTERIEINGEYIRTYGYGTPGSYALLSVEDTGTGMDEQVRNRIFEPFFTTKEVGKGTGLGLSMVYGIVKQHSGYINVYSEPGRGTAFKILLPLVHSEVQEMKFRDSQALKGGTETILIGEDDLQVRNLLKEVLSNAGYHIMEAIDGADTINVFHQYKDTIHLLILDVIMPKKNGKEVYSEIKRLKPDMKAIFVSGYSADIIRKKGILDVGLHFISKPVAPDELLRAVRNILDS